VSFETTTSFAILILKGVNFGFAETLQQVQVQNGLQISLVSFLWLWDCELSESSVLVLQSLYASLHGIIDNAKM